MLAMSNKNDKPEKRQLDPTIFKDFMEVQRQQIGLEKGKQDIQRQDLKNQSDLAKKSLDLQAELLRSAPSERRKDRTQMIWVSIIIIIILLMFCGYCLQYGHAEFLKYFIGAVTHLLTLLIGYYFGARNRNSSTVSSEYEDVEYND